jgi:hypothetical protein
MTYVLSIFGICAAIAMIKYRGQITDIIGEPDWMRVFGNANNFVVFLAVFIIFFCIAASTGTIDILFSPILWILPGVHGGGGAAQGIVR